ncbi:SBBP repeat-containing protein [Acidobacteriota bacterium]
MNNKKRIISLKIVCTLMLVTFFIVSMATDIPAQAVEEWRVRYNGPANRHDLADAMALDSSGNVYVTGISYGTSVDYATVAYDTNGNQLWEAQYDGPSNGNDYPVAIAVDSSGNVFVTGYSNNEPTQIKYDYATVAYNSSGTQLWVARYSGPWNYRNIAEDIAVDSLGNVYVTGTTNSGSTTSYATVAYDSSGNQRWERIYSEMRNNSAQAIALDSSGNVYVSGGVAHYDGYDITTIAYDSAGTQLWVARYDGTLNGRSGCNDIAVNSLGNIYVTGFSSDTFSSKDYDYVTIAYDSGGNELWAKRYNGPDNLHDEANAIAVGPSGNVYVTGKSNGSYGGVTEYDYGTVAYSSAGTELWMRRYNGQGKRDAANDIAVDLNGNVYVTGHTYGFGTSSDYATVAYDSSGNQVWVAIYNGPVNNYDEANAIAIDSWGNVFVTGRSYVGSGGEDQDFVTIKYGSNLINTPPVAVCKDIEIPLDENCHATITPEDLDGGSYDPDGVDDIDEITINHSGFSAPGSYSVTFSITDKSGETDTCLANVKVVDITPPTPDESELPHITGECSVDVATTPTASDNCGVAIDGTTSDPLSYTMVGTHIITWTYTDDSGNSTTQDQIVVVEDNTAPQITTITTSRGRLWPANHQMITITLTGEATDNCDPEPKFKILSVTSNEPINGLGDGDTAPDWEIKGDMTVDLRAERAGGGNSRLYTITVEVTDVTGNKTTGTVKVIVPKDMGNDKGGVTKTKKIG